MHLVLCNTSMCQCHSVSFWPLYLIKKRKQFVITWMILLWTLGLNDFSVVCAAEEQLLTHFSVHWHSCLSVWGCLVGWSSWSLCSPPLSHHGRQLLSVAPHPLVGTTSCHSPVTETDINYPCRWTRCITMNNAKWVSTSAGPEQQLYVLCKHSNSNMTH